MTNCETCGSKEPFTVACVPGVPYSAAYCKNCLWYDAHPFWILKSYISSALKPGQANRWSDSNIINQDYIDSLNTFLDGRYMSLREALILQPIIEEELKYDLR